MSGTPYNVHHWTIGTRFSPPVPTGNVLDFAIEREPSGERLFCVWAEDRGDGQVSVRWSRAPDLFAEWRKPNSVNYFTGHVFGFELQFARDRLLLSYMTNTHSTRATHGECTLHWKRLAGGPWSEGVIVREHVCTKPPEPNYPFDRQVHHAADPDGNEWALVVNRRFVEPTYALYPLSAPARAMMAPNPWEDGLIYTGVVAGASDHAHLVWANHTWHIVRRAFDDRADAYSLEAIALDLDLLRIDHNQDGQTDIVDAITEFYDESMLYMLWEECDLEDMFHQTGTLVGIQHPNQRAGRIDPSARHVFETASSLAHVRKAHPRGAQPRLEIVGRGQHIPVEGLRRAASPSATATPWQQFRPDSLTFAVDCHARDEARGWMTRGMLVAEAGVFFNSASFEAIVEWRVHPMEAGWRGYAYIFGFGYETLLSGVEKLPVPSRHRTKTWVGKLYTHRIFGTLNEYAPLTAGLRFPLIAPDREQRYRVVGIAEITSFQ